jgi:hypothetical protein
MYFFMHERRRANVEAVRRGAEGQPATLLRQRVSKSTIKKAKKADR